ncbi:MAG TPA: peptidoglycan-binding domain-containing protein [Pyrinomonadaceae bacterium]|nr:peptidoglycan-binding domain-containing protein [Pyrinomonadaceae bacterium]
MTTGKEMVTLAISRVGQKYENVLVPKNNANWHGPWDCAEFMSWLVFQSSGILYGCLDDNAPPPQADAYTGAWRRDSANLGKRITVDRAAAIEGAFVLRFPPGPGMMGHVAISKGQGGTVEAKSHVAGVVEDKIDGRRWDTGVLIPGVTYDDTVPSIPVTPGRVIHMGGTNDPNIVRSIQNALAIKNIDPGPIDGKYGPLTTAAVAAFQQREGLLVDGEVGPETAAALGVQL